MGTGHTVTHPFTAVNVHMSTIRCTLDADHAQDTYLAYHWVKPSLFLSKNLAGTRRDEQSHGRINGSSQTTAKPGTPRM
jgi:hypothetical protein